MSYRSEVLEDSPLAYFRLNDVNTTAVNEVAGGASGTYAGTYTQRAPGATQDGDGSLELPITTGSTVSGRMDVTLSGVNTGAGTDVTVEFWMWWAGSPTNGDIIAFNSAAWPTEGLNYALWIGNDSGSGYNGWFGFNSYNNDFFGVTISGNIQASRWHHMVGIFRNGARDSSRLFIDGTEKALSQQSNPAGPQQTCSNYLRVGAGSGPQWGWDGRVDEVSVYNGALSSARITAHYLAGLNDGRFTASQRRARSGVW